MTRSRGARRAPLTLPRIVDETLAMIDEQGIAAASMRTVAQRLGVQPMSLYRHVQNREDLFDAVVERVVDELSHDARVAASADDIGWRAYLERLAWGVRRYARAHPHAFPLVATRPPTAPWINPPLRSLRWIENMLAALERVGFDDQDILFTYRSFNSFLLGYLLLETSAMVLAEPRPGDGSFQTGDSTGLHDPVDPADPVPGALSPTRETDERHAIDDASGADELMDLSETITPADHPVLHRLRHGLTEDHYEAEFAAGLDVLLDRVAAVVSQSDGLA